MNKLIFFVAALIIWPIVELLKCRIKKDDYATEEEYLAAKFAVYPKMKSALIKLGLILVLIVLGLVYGEIWIRHQGLADLILIIAIPIIFYLGFQLRRRR